LVYFLTRYGKNKPNSIKFKSKKNVYLIFGKESSGIEKSILEKNKNFTIRIPTSKNIRSLNLANCVAILAYEYMKQNDFTSLEAKEPHKIN
jgi:tRNA (cytidine/uridine-2'-O-)-methyltransferase